MGVPPRFTAEKGTDSPRPAVAAASVATGPHPAVDPILRLQRAAGNRAVVGALTAGSVPIVQRALTLTTGWNPGDKARYEGVFKELERCLALLKGKEEEGFKRVQAVAAIFSKYDNKAIPNSADASAQLQKVEKEMPYIRNLAAKYGGGPASDKVADLHEAVGSKDESEDEDSGREDERLSESSEDGSEGEEADSREVAIEEDDDDSALLALAGSSNTGRQMATQKAKQEEVNRRKADAAKHAAKLKAYYASLTPDDAKNELGKWVDKEADRMVKEIRAAFANNPSTYGSSYYSQPDRELLAIAKRTSDTLYEEIAAKIKSAFPDGASSHIPGFNYHHTKVKTKGAGGFNLTGWRLKHQNGDKSPFNLHVVHQ